MSTLTAPPPRTSVATTQQAILVLEPLQKRLRLKQVLLQSGKCTIGSAPDCTLTLAADGIRTHHCLIVSGKGRTVLKAWDTRTWLNDGPVDEALLKAGDRLVIGPVEFRVREASKAEILSAQKSSFSLSTSAGINGKNNLEHAVHAAIHAGILPSSAASLPIPGTTDQADHADVSESEVHITPSEPKNASSEFTLGPSASPGTTSESGEQTPDELESLHAKLQEQTDRLYDDITLQQTKLRQLLQRQKAVRVDENSHNHDADLTEQRAKTARRKEVLLRDLLNIVRSECEGIIAGKRDMRQVQRRQRDTLARLQNELAIEAAQLREARQQDQNARRDFECKTAKQFEATQRAEIDLEDEFTKVRAEAESLRSEQHSLAEVRHHVEEERALLKLEQQRVEQSGLEAEARLRRDREAIADQQREADARLKDLTKEVAELAAREVEVERQQARLHTQQQSLETERDELDSAQSQFHTECEQSQSEQAKLQDAQAQLQASNEQLEEERSSLEAKAADLEQLESRQAELTSERARIKDERKELGAERKLLTSQQDDWKRKQEELLLREAELSTERDATTAEREELSLARQEFEAEKDRQQEERNSLDRDREVFSNQQGEIATEQARLVEDREALEQECEAVALRTQEQKEQRSKSAGDLTDEPQIDPASLQQPIGQKAGFDAIGQPLDEQPLQSAEEEAGVLDAGWPFSADKKPAAAHAAEADEADHQEASPASDLTEGKQSTQDSDWLLEQRSIDIPASASPSHDDSDEGGLRNNPTNLPLNSDSDVEDDVPATGENYQSRAGTLGDSQDAQPDSHLERETPDDSFMSWLQAGPSELDTGLTEDGSSPRFETDTAEVSLDDTGVASLDPTEQLDADDASTTGEGDLISMEPHENTTAEADTEPVEDADEDASPLSDLRSDLSALFALPTSDSEQSKLDQTVRSASQEADEHSAGDEQSSLTDVLASLVNEDTSDDVQSFDASDGELPISADVSRDQSGVTNEPAVGQPPRDDYMLDDADDPDSVSAYMDRLLTRSQSRAEAATGALHRPELSANKASQISRSGTTSPVRQKESVTEQTTNDAADAPEGSLEAVATQDTSCQPQVDKEAVRAHILSLREVANLSARTAIAKHSSKMKRSLLMVKGLLLVASASVAALLLTSETWGSISYVPLGWSTLAISVVVVIEIVRSTVSSHRINRARKEAYTSDEEASSFWSQEPETHDES